MSQEAGILAIRIRAELLEDVAREIDGAVPTGPKWHRDLLVQLSAEFPGIRPTVLQRRSRLCLIDERRSPQGLSLLPPPISVSEGNSPNIPL